MKKFKIGHRTIKTGLGTVIAIMIAQWLGLTNFSSAGILTILCIQVTKKKSIQSAWERFLACSFAIVFAFVFFEGIAYHPVVIGLLLLFFIPTMVVIKATEGIVTSSVILLHMYSYGEVTFEHVANEALLIFIGIGVALIMNLYMPSLEGELHKYQVKLEEQFERIFLEVENYLRTGESHWNGRELTEVDRILKKAKSLAFRDVENHFLREENLYYHYFKMREKQFEIIERSLPIITTISLNVEQGEMLADFVHELSCNIHPGNTAKKYIWKLNEMRKKFQEMPLPSSREEFEVRAALFHFVYELEQYLSLKNQFKGMASSSFRKK
ncbi:aromatic acid exporter family protein [Bacillus carboniphilus]|uniref:Aromatic acid exporter family protein n=1 Tax=Bacillus carboniphilus TaxID=86663 RepID=A0ABY9JZ72_9BACI|nr:aromatic acid exporter family protein [Bacillus carboniphilus]WLR43862.1 aromatic acid exporter family protein [Bacillus carboniphilus]